MNDQLLIESVRLCQLQLLLRLGVAEEGHSDSAAALLKHWNAMTSRIGNAEIGVRLNLSVEEVARLSTLMKEAVLSRKAQRPEQQPEGAVLQQLQRLRFLTRVESIVQTYDPAYRTVVLETQQPQVLAQKQVRALELVVRALIQEKYVVEETLIDRLRVILSNEDIGQMIRKGRPDGVLAGTLFKQLIGFFTDPREWVRYAPLYHDAKGFNLLKDQRTTIVFFLTDINALRNVVAHHRSLSGAQIELLNIYYSLLVDPIQRAFEAGAVAVDPSLLIEVDRVTLDQYISSLRVDVQVLSRQSERTEAATNKTRLMVTILLALVLAGLVGAAAFYQHRQHTLAIAYQSLGWATASSLGWGAQPHISSVVFLGDETVSFGELGLTAVALHSGYAPITLDLTTGFDRSQVGGEQSVDYTVPQGTRTLILCLVVPSRQLSAKYRVTQVFNLDLNQELTTRSDKIVSKEDGSACSARQGS